MSVEYVKHIDEVGKEAPLEMSNRFGLLPIVFSDYDKQVFLLSTNPVGRRARVPILAHFPIPSKPLRMFSKLPTFVITMPPQR